MSTASQRTQSTLLKILEDILNAQKQNQIISKYTYSCMYCARGIYRSYRNREKGNG